MPRMKEQSSCQDWPCLLPSHRSRPPSWRSHKGQHQARLEIKNFLWCFGRRDGQGRSCHCSGRNRRCRGISRTITWHDSCILSSTQGDRKTRFCCVDLFLMSTWVVFYKARMFHLCDRNSITIYQLLYINVACGVLGIFPVFIVGSSSNSTVWCFLVRSLDKRCRLCP